MEKVTSLPLESVSCSFAFAGVIGFVRSCPSTSAT